MSHTRILHAIFNSPWAIDLPWLDPMFSLLHARLFAGEQSGVLEAPRQLGAMFDDPILIPGGLRAGGMRSGGGRFGLSRWGRTSGGSLVNHSARIHYEAARRANDPGTYHQIVRQEEEALPAGQILVIYGSGILGKHLSSMDELCSGGLSIDRIQEAVRAGRDDDKVQAIMLWIDSPGGTVHGCIETAALIREVREKKTVADFCDSLTASAGKWAVCCSDYSYITPGADCGSIGVYAVFRDYAEWCKKEGIKVDVIGDGGKFKGAGIPGTSLTPEQRAKIQEAVVASSNAFKADMRRGRAGISDDTMQGQCFTGPAAVEAKLADAVVNDLEAALRDLSQAI